jgi:hypothetical protein
MQFLQKECKNCIFALIGAQSWQLPKPVNSEECMFIFLTKEKGD